MADYQYLKLDKVEPDDLVAVLNKSRIREHLIDHDEFNSVTIKAWIKDKIEVDATDGCRVRGVVVNGEVAGWCGIQLENEQFEIAIVLDEKFWGIGKQIFVDMMNWARQLGHKEVYIHFLDTRPEYKFLKKISIKVFETDMLGRKFTTYQLRV